MMLTCSRANKHPQQVILMVTCRLFNFKGFLKNKCLYFDPDASCFLTEAAFSLPQPPSAQTLSTNWKAAVNKLLLKFHMWSVVGILNRQNGQFRQSDVFRQTKR